MAATLSDGQELTRVSIANIEKWEEDPDGTLYVYGKATTPEVDTDEQVVASEWSGAALKQWLDEAPALRVQHNSQRDPAGSGVALEVNRDGDGAHWLKAAVDEPVAQRLVKKRHLRAFSVGIARPVIERDVTGKARGGIIKGGRIVEVSLVDSPANRSCFLELAKAARDGSPEWSGKVGGGDLLTKAGDDGMVNVDIPKGASISISPADLAKLHTFRQQLATRAADPAEAVKAAEAAIYKRDIDTATRRRLAKEGRALPDGSYPVETHEDAENAVTLILSGHGNVNAAKKMVRRIARKEGWTDILDRLAGRKKDGSDASKGATVSEPAQEDTTAVKDAGAVKDGGEDDLRHDDGQDDDTDSEADALDKAAAPPKLGKVPCPKCKAMCKAKAKFCGKCGCAMTAEKAAEPTAGEGVTGQAAADIKPAPPHREPDGPAFEAFEHDAGLPTVPDSQFEMKAAARHRALGVPSDAGWLHDALCPAYDPADVAKCYPRQDFSVIDEYAWQAKALDIAATAPLEQAAKAMDLWQHAKTLKALPAGVAADLAAEAHKAFRDANPGPATAPSPMEVTADRFRRPLIEAGHAAPSPGQDPPHTSPVHPEPQSADLYTRGPLTDGHAADSPGNDRDRPAPIPAPAVPGVPSRVYYSNTQRDNARQAMAAMHDHIAATFPDLCPMHGPGHMGEPPSHARPVAPGVGGPVPHRGKAASGKKTKTASGKAKVSKADKAAARAAKLHRQLIKSLKASGLTSGGTVKGTFSGYAPLHGAAEPVTAPVWHAADAAAIDPEVIKSAVADTMAPLRAELAELRRVADAIADQPDPRVTAYRGPVLNKTSAAPAAPLDPRGYEDRVRANVLHTMYDQYRNSADPTLREEAWHFLLKEAGIDVTKNV